MSNMPPTNADAISPVEPNFRNRFDAILISFAVLASVLTGHVPASLYRSPQSLGETRCCV